MRSSPILRQLPNFYYNNEFVLYHTDVMISATAPQIIGVLVVCSAVCSGANQQEYQRPTSLAFVRGIHRWPVNSPHKGPVTWKRFPFDDVTMYLVQIIVSEINYRVKTIQFIVSDINNRVKITMKIFTRALQNASLQITSNAIHIISFPTINHFQSAVKVWKFSEINHLWQDSSPAWLLSQGITAMDRRHTKILLLHIFCRKFDIYICIYHANTEYLSVQHRRIECIVTKWW